LRGDLTNPPIIVRISRWKGILAAIGGLCFVLLGVLLLQAQQGWLIPLVTIVFFGFCTVAAFIGIVRPESVILDSGGVTIFSAWKTTSIPWRHVDGFRAVTVHNVKLVGFDVSPEYKGFETLRRMNRRLAGVDASFPAHLEIPQTEMLSLVLAAQERWAALAV